MIFCTTLSQNWRNKKKRILTIFDDVQTSQISRRSEVHYVDGCIPFLLNFSSKLADWTVTSIHGNCFTYLSIKTKNNCTQNMQVSGLRIKRMTICLWSKRATRPNCCKILQYLLIIDISAVKVKGILKSVQ